MGAMNSELMSDLQKSAAAKSAEINQSFFQFLIKLLGKTRDQQVSAGSIYRPNFMQRIPTSLTLQLKMHAAVVRILMKIFTEQFQSQTSSSS